MKPTLLEYNTLNLHQKATILGQATFVARHLSSGIIYSLYTYRDFYIELGVDAATKYIIEITAINTQDRLDKHLSQISLGNDQGLRQAS